MRAAIYCRVSTDSQETEGTSLQTQLEACTAYCKGKGYDIAYQFSEVCSGLTLDRPKLNELRELVRTHDVDAVVIHCLDRLSRDPVHGVIVTEELQKHNVSLEAVTETVESTDLGKLISYVRGYAAKLEAQKIRERTMRGARKRAETGKIPIGGTGHLYGYCYVKGKERGQGVRIENPDESKWVKEMFRWLAEERLSSEAITCKLRDLEVPRPSGKGYWLSSTVKKILKNPAYCGKTYVFSYMNVEPKFRVKSSTKRKKSSVVRRPREEWLELPNATPPIISESLYLAAQAQLAENRRMAGRNSKGEYLLHGHVRCELCGRAYRASGGWRTRGGKQYHRPYYRCAGTMKQVTPDKCKNKQYNGAQLESWVWNQLEKVLTKPELVFSELENQRARSQTALLETELDTVTLQLGNRIKQKERVWTAFRLTGDEIEFRTGIKIVEKDTEELRQKRAILENQIEEANKFNPDMADIKKACELVAGNLHNFTYEEKRFVLLALNIKVLIGSDNIRVQGFIPVQTGAVADTSITCCAWAHASSG